MPHPQDGSSNDDISTRDIHENLIPRGTLKTRNPLPITREFNEGDYYLREVHLEVETTKLKRSLPWFAFTISIGFFIINKAIQSVANFTPDTKTIIDIVVVIGIITSLMVYARYYFGDKNG